MHNSRIVWPVGNVHARGNLANLKSPQTVVEVSISTCKKRILSRMKPTDKKRESIKSTSTSETPSMPCRRQLSGTWWTCSYTRLRRWLTEADLLQCNGASGSKRRRKCNNHIWFRCSARKHHVPATVRYRYQRSLTDAHGDWAESGYQSWFTDWQEPGRQRSRRRPRLSV